MQIQSIQDSIQQYNENVSQIQKLHARLVDTTDDAAVERYNQQLQDLVDKNRSLSDKLRNRIKALQRQGGSGQIGMIRKQQVRPARLRVCGGGRRTGLADRGCVCGAAD